MLDAEKVLKKLYNQQRRKYAVCVPNDLKLAYLPEKEIFSVYKQNIAPQIKTFSEDWSNEEQKAVTKLLNYLEKYYFGAVVIRKKRKNPLFSKSLWNTHEQMLQQADTSNNEAEGWNSNRNYTS